MQRKLIPACVIVALLTGPAFAQNSGLSVPATGESHRRPQRKSTSKKLLIAPIMRPCRRYPTRSHPLIHGAMFARVRRRRRRTSNNRYGPGQLPQTLYPPSRYFNVSSWPEAAAPFPTSWDVRFHRGKAAVTRISRDVAVDP